jgi:hypothetical protein
MCRIKVIGASTLLQLDCSKNRDKNSGLPGYTDKRGSNCAAKGSNERDHKNGLQVTIRDLVLGAELAASTKDRADYLELRANAQFTVPEDQLVESVRKVLVRHGAWPAAS